VGNPIGKCSAHCGRHETEWFSHGRTCKDAAGKLEEPRLRENRIAASVTRPRSLTSKPLLSVSETAVLLGENRATLYRAIQRGEFPLPVFQIGGRMRIARQAVNRLLADEFLGPFDRALGETDQVAPPLTGSRPMCTISRNATRSVG
jgi:excisionase family DNA binding protein